MRAMGVQRLEETDLQALRAGDRRASERFYRQHAPTVLGWAIRLGGPGVEPEDATQQVFATAFRRIGGFRGDASPSTWLFAITHKVLANHRRRARLRAFFGLERAPEPVCPAGGPGAAVERMQLRARVRAALDTLTLHQREVVVLMDLEERTTAEVAEMLGIPQGTVSSRVFSGRQQFARAMRALEDQP